MIKYAYLQGTVDALRAFRLEKLAANVKLPVLPGGGAFHPPTPKPVAPAATPAAAPATPSTAPASTAMTAGTPPAASSGASGAATPAEKPGRVGTFIEGQKGHLQNLRKGLGGMLLHGGDTPMGSAGKTMAWESAKGLLPSAGIAIGGGLLASKMLGKSEEEKREEARRRMMGLG